MHNGTDVIDVDEFASNIKSIVNKMPRIRIRGLIGKVTRASSGHTYFETAGGSGRVSCVVWASTGLLKIRPGSAILSVGKVDFYPPHGKLSAVISSIEYDDDDETRLTAKQTLIGLLHTEGQLDRPRLASPEIVTHLCLVTSIGSAAYHDMVRAVEERWPELRMTVMDTLVQGERAPTNIINALKKAICMAPSVIICARGGGSEADLSAFDDEKLARAMCSSPVPIVSAVGHESDHSVCDAVADIRAKTPTAAIEIILPRTRKERVDQLGELKIALNESLRRQIVRFDTSLTTARCSLYNGLCVATRHGLDTTEQLKKMLFERMRSKLENHAVRLHQQRSCCVTHARAILKRHETSIDQYRRLLYLVPDGIEQRCQHTLQALRNDVKSASPYTMLRRGLALVQRNKRRLECAADLEDGDQIDILFADGRVGAVVCKCSRP